MTPVNSVRHTRTVGAVRESAGLGWRDFGGAAASCLVLFKIFAEYFIDVTFCDVSYIQF